MFCDSGSGVISGGGGGNAALLCGLICRRVTAAAASTAGGAAAWRSVDGMHTSRQHKNTSSHARSGAIRTPLLLSIRPYHQSFRPNCCHDCDTLGN